MISTKLNGFCMVITHAALKCRTCIERISQDTLVDKFPVYLPINYYSICFDSSVKLGTDQFFPVKTCSRFY